MTRWQYGSLFIVIFCFIIMGVWDVIAFYHGGRKATISYIFTMAAYYLPIVVFFLGAVAGHLFWSQTAYQDEVTIERRTEIVTDENGNVKSYRTKVYRIDE